jgi:hypothetical protein
LRRGPGRRGRRWDGRGAGTRGAIARRGAARASRGRAAVRARWKEGKHRRLCSPIAEQEWCARLAGDASERGHGERGRGKGARRLGSPVAERSERAGERSQGEAERGALRGERREEEEGKADKRVPLVSCPGRKMRGRNAVRPASWAGPWPVGCVGGREKKRGRWVGHAQVGRWAVCVGFWPMVVKVIRV